jgi:hypothetical protein
MKFLPSTNTHRLVAGLAEALCGWGGASQRGRLGAFVPWISEFQPDLNPSHISPDEF